MTLFDEIQYSLLDIELPNNMWTATMKLGEFIAFIRVNHSLQNFLIVVFNHEMSGKVYNNHKLLDWLEWKTPHSKKEVEKIIQLLHECILS